MRQVFILYRSSYDDCASNEDSVWQNRRIGVYANEKDARDEAAGLNEERTEDDRLLRRVFYDYETVDVIPSKGR
jgi:hypothetical protein